MYMSTILFKRSTIHLFQLSCQAANESTIVEAASAEANQSITPVQPTELKADKNSGKGKKAKVNKCTLIIAII